MNVIFITAINVGEDIIKFYASFGQTVSCKSDINLPTHVCRGPSCVGGPSCIPRMIPDDLHLLFFSNLCF